MGEILWNKQISDKGTVGTNLDVALTDNKTLSEMFVSAPLAADNATLKIYKDSVSAPTLIFDGYMANRDVDGKIVFREPTVCDDKFIILVTGGSGDVIALTRYN